jgi:hypothetical protein
MKHLLAAFIMLALIIPSSVQGLAFYSDGTVFIDQPIADDVIVSGGVVEINSPVQSLIAAGGTVEVNAPVEGDIIAAGGTVTLNGDTGGKAVLAGGTIRINGNISRNLVAYGGDIAISPTSTIGRDAAISGGTVTNEGHVTGTLHASGQQVENTGFAGVSDIQVEEKKTFDVLASLFHFLFAAGMLILGLILLHLCPKKFRAVTETINKRPIICIALGIGGLIGGVIVIVLLTITLVGIPFAALLLFGLISGLLLSTLFVSLAIGDVICARLHIDWKDWQRYLLGFILLSLSFMIPLAGPIIIILAVIIGLGGIVHTLYENRGFIIEKS